ncbi:MAG TPA: transcription-repair coupling factor [Luteolibacter sp.]|nr:transcription-repair coupling factor [Luteolibacter sp.]
MSPSDSRAPEHLRRALHHPDFSARLSSWDAGEDELVFDHVAEAAQGFYAALCCRAGWERGRRHIWLVCERPRQRERLAAEMELWGISSLILPEAPAESGDGTIADPEAAAEWFAVLEALAGPTPCAVWCASESFTQAAPAPQALHDGRRTLRPGDALDPIELATTLQQHGYQRVATVASRGQFAVRGGIIDLFAWQAPTALRFECFDTQLESIRSFDLDSQASTGRLPSAELLLSEPAAEATVADYRSPRDLLVAFDEVEIADADARILEAAATLDGEEDFTLAAHGSPLGSFEAGDFVLEETRREQFFRQLNEWRREQWEVAMVFANRGEEERFAELAGQDLQRDLNLSPMRGELSASFILPALRLAVLSSQELFGRYRSPPGKRRSSLEQARAARARATIDEIDEGDLVVHYEYGLAKYRGVQQGADGEELLLEYKDGALLGVPIEQAHLVGKYVGMGGKTPDLNKLGSAAWKNARRSAEKSILDYAAQLLRVQAERQHEPGHAHPPDSRWMWEFERSFHFTETTDQRRAIEDTKHDMELARPMDRLICGDVGFGKTEVAIRAAFKAVTGGKQVAMLVPTTVLAEQHWRTLRERMSDYPVQIRLLNRFRSAEEVRETIRGLADGSVDIVIGTHRLISGDVHFKDLGLVIIDEEQRFGVAHKEKFKQLFRQIDVLTLSATPIPRTLYMALMGARDMSTIETPPPNRVPVATTVCAYDERIIRDAIQREMKRGGQIFFLHNRVSTIEQTANRLRELVPEARIVVGHGQMDKDDLEVVMHTFVKGEADVLLATTIIETGIDIPNANTILIDRADRFGLADLYQLRGRVGRAGEKAYAYLLLPRDMMTRGDARKRIHAIKQYTALGSGFKIAMRDLEIRGAGNLLGTKQSGHIAQIGFELYCQLLRQSVDRLKSGQQGPQGQATFKADFVAATEGAWLRQRSAVSGQRSAGRAAGAPEQDSGLTGLVSSVSKSSVFSFIPAFLPATWLAETSLRIAAYRELSEASSLKALDTLEASWTDRFGRLPEAVTHLLAITRIKALAARHKIASVEISGQRLMLHRNGDYILLEGRRFPKLKAATPADKLAETEKLLKQM